MRLSSTSSRRRARVCGWSARCDGAGALTGTNVRRHRSVNRGGILEQEGLPHVRLRPEFTGTVPPRVSTCGESTDPGTRRRPNITAVDAIHAHL